MEHEELMRRFAVLAEADFQANGGYMNSPYRIRYKGVYYKGRLCSIPIMEDQKRVGFAYRIDVEVPVTHVGNVNLRDIKDVNNGN